MGWAFQHCDLTALINDHWQDVPDPADPCGPVSGPGAVPVPRVQDGGAGRGGQPGAGAPPPHHRPRQHLGGEGRGAHHREAGQMGELLRLSLS